ncbi:hypothetical protein K505DRAFT_362882 [Melanomma pulvis-pyrius CBS 109.77]|uniref:Uncharacterized protein n=1 Tax=Melanomma pulvis-pyrius CBS 109.77 TaxID=1314802 RepID=A0A6A6X7V3_9PLEO|nr:hypothetical protein K505DRAFT_362882 [Melanomma pulvis-pyrius CBS 109.77]
MLHIRTCSIKTLSPAPRSHGPIPGRLQCDRTHRPHSHPNIRTRHRAHIPHDHSLLPPKPEPYKPPTTARIKDILLSSYGLTAPNGTFEKASLHIASPDRDGENIDPRHNSLVIFMPTTRLFYSQIASTIASKGYTVVAIDAPYDVDIVEYPDQQHPLGHQRRRRTPKDGLHRP